MDFSLLRQKSLNFLFNDMGFGRQELRLFCDIVHTHFSIMYVP